MNERESPHTQEVDVREVTVVVVGDTPLICDATLLERVREAMGSWQCYWSRCQKRRR
jgi:hypothetical protein